LIDHAEDGMTVAAVRKLFAELRAGLVPLIEAIRSRPPIDDSCLTGQFAEPAQWAFGEKIARAFGYDYERGRGTAHPFMIKLGLGDVRITTATAATICRRPSRRCRDRPALTRDSTRSTARRSFGGTTAGVHEKPVTVVENLVGAPRVRSHWYAPLQAAFPDALRGVDVDTFYRAINKVAPSLIRTDADEVTYNLHVMLRFDLELALLEGTLSVADLPDAWRERVRDDLGVTPPDDRDGVLQDVHWYGGAVGGAFQSYTLGNIMSAQFFAAARRDIAELDDQIGASQFAPLRAWLTDRIYRHGRKFTAPEIVERATGEPLSIAPYLAYLNKNTASSSSDRAPRVRRCACKPKARFS
jgi:carboxypeptidase Taq